MNKFFIAAMIAAITLMSGGANTITFCPPSQQQAILNYLNGVGPKDCIDISQLETMR